jgi:histone-lysine N-methyltransferase SETMAR
MNERAESGLPGSRPEILISTMHHAQDDQSRFDDDQINTLIENNPRYATRVIAEILKISHTAVVEQLHKLGYAIRLDVCDSLYKRNENDPFCKVIVTGDKKWIVCNNVEQKRSRDRQGERPLLTPTAELHQKKVMLCVWWDWKEILYYDLLPRNQIINSDVYCSQLDRMKAAIDQKRPESVNRKGVVFHNDNTRPHVSLATLQKLM